MGGMNWHPCGFEKKQVEYIKCLMGINLVEPFTSWARERHQAGHWCLGPILDVSPSLECILSWAWLLIILNVEVGLHHSKKIMITRAGAARTGNLLWVIVSLLMFCAPFWHCSTGHILDLTSMRNWRQHEEEHHRLWMERLRAWHGALHSPGSCGTTVRNRRVFRKWQP